ncbi:hypothetical protein [Campylobacter sp.]|uniref:hypothetical protein n=1 Tax=Campylobacter sp. TaxID=205 RepID=UPI002A755A64|nr:hypothetical protein [Campylobacter sp.]MDY3245843.1 hypothetical protein [Campylobacter sp.]
MTFDKSNTTSSPLWAWRFFVYFGYFYSFFYYNLSKNLDCLQMAYERTDITHFALVASDSDFRHLLSYLIWGVRF